MSLTNPRYVSICLLIALTGFSPTTTPVPVGPLWQSPNLTVRIDPTTQNVELGHTFTVDVMVEGAENLGGFQFDMVYNPAVLMVTQVELGPFLGSTGRTAQSLGSDIDNVVGIVTFGAFSFGSDAGPDGSGLLAVITLSAVGSGTSALNLQNVLVTDAAANARSVSVEGGEVTIGAPTPTSRPTMTPEPTMPPSATPTLINTATPIRTAEPVITLTPTGAAPATATGEPVVTPTPPPVTTETITPAATVGPTLAESPISTPSERATPLATWTPTPTDPLTSTSTETSWPKATVTGMISRPGAVLQWTPTFTSRPLKASPPTWTVSALASASPVSSSSPETVWPSRLCWLSAGGVSLIAAVLVFRVLMRWYRE